MRRLSALFLWMLGIATGFADTSAVCPEQPPAEQLFQTAMKFELDGDNYYRDMTLRAALAEDAEYAKARWHLGQLAVAGKWQHVDELVNRTNPILTEYGERRRKSSGDPQSELALAKWCRANKLTQREQLHLVRVMANPQTAPALREIAARRLQLKNVDGRWMTEQQLVAIQQREARIVADYKTWAPQLARWRDALASGSQRQREEAQAALADMRDPAAVLALEYELGGSSEAAALLAIQALGNIPHHDASLALARMALGTPWPRVMDAASQQLKTRPMHEYVPTLLANLDTQVQLVSSPTKVYAWGNASAQQQVFFKEGMDTNQMFILNRLASTGQVKRPAANYLLSQRLGNQFLSGEQQLADQPALREAINNNTSLDARRLQQELNSINGELDAKRADEQLYAAAAIDTARARQAKAQVDAENQRIAAVNARTWQVLRQATGRGFLVHDNTYRAPTGAVVPGYRPDQRLAAK